VDANDNRKVSVRISADGYKRLREIANELNREFDLVGKESATINDVIDGLLYGYELDKDGASKAPLARLGSLVIKRTVRTNV
jgi:hypothetical protein